MGVPPPRGGPSWKQCSVKKILTNPAYKGEVVYKKTKRVNNKSVLRPPEEWIVAKAHMSELLNRSYGQGPGKDT
jgi:hypothetical protein